MFELLVFVSFLSDTWSIPRTATILNSAVDNEIKQKTNHRTFEICKPSELMSVERPILRRKTQLVLFKYNHSMHINHNNRFKHWKNYVFHIFKYYAVELALFTADDATQSFTIAIVYDLLNRHRKTKKWIERLRLKIIEHQRDSTRLNKFWFQIELITNWNWRTILFTGQLK